MEPSPEVGSFPGVPPIRDRGHVFTVAVFTGTARLPGSAGAVNAAVCLEDVAASVERFCRPEVRTVGGFYERPQFRGEEVSVAASAADMRRCCLMMTYVSTGLEHRQADEQFEKRGVRTGPREA